MNEGSSWFVFDGYMDFMLKEDLGTWMEELGSAVVTDVGHFPIYGCSDYSNLQVQQLYTKEIEIKYARDSIGSYVRAMAARHRPSYPGPLGRLTRRRVMRKPLDFRDDTFIQAMSKS